ncbi:ATP-binding protein [Thermopolyspora sp. NPDC052614]|uniref:sensor histidine kinase n=1 Tax=Thermopolyspora sp. NPDC052614 TaxID=3155682 RepID=UPI003447D88C
MRGDRGLSQMLEDHFAEWSERTGIAVEVWALPRREPSPRVVANVYATVREALDNVALHSRARTVSVALTVGPSGLRLTVSDDGHGFPSWTTGRGLVAMRAYFAEIGGRLTVNSVPGGGTTVSGFIPAEALTS